MSADLRERIDEAVRAVEPAAVAGPWRVARINGMSRYLSIVSNAGGEVATSVYRAKAQAIARLPDLVALLREARDALTR